MGVGRLASLQGQRFVVCCMCCMLVLVMRYASRWRSKRCGMLDALTFHVLAFVILCKVCYIESYLNSPTTLCFLDSQFFRLRKDLQPPSNDYFVKMPVWRRRYFCSLTGWTVWQRTGSSTLAAVAFTKTRNPLSTLNNFTKSKALNTVAVSLSKALCFVALFS